MVCSICQMAGHNRRTCPQLNGGQAPQEPMPPQEPVPPQEPRPAQAPVEEINNIDNAILDIEKMIENHIMYRTINTLSEGQLIFIKELTGLIKKQFKIINLSFTDPLYLYMSNQNFQIEPDLNLNRNPVFIQKIEPRSVNVIDIFTGYILCLVADIMVAPSLISNLCKDSSAGFYGRFEQEYKKTPDGPSYKLIDIVLDNEITKPRQLNKIMIFNSGNQNNDLLVDVFRRKNVTPYPSLPKKESEVLFSALKMNYLMKEMIRLGGLENDNLGCILDLHQDVKIPEHDDLDLEASGVPNKLFTNVT